MDSIPIHADSDRSALGFTIPSVFVILSYVVVFIFFGSDSFSRVPLLFVAGPFLLLASIGGIPAIRRSHLPSPVRILLFACHALAAVLALLPFIGFVLLFFLLDGPVNPG